MIIVAGHIRLDPEHRSAYLEGCHHVVVAARAAEGCQDFHLSADLLEPDRINVYEAWDSVEAVEAFRGSGPDDGQGAMIRAAAVNQYDVSSVTDLTG